MIIAKLYLWKSSYECQWDHKSLPPNFGEFVQVLRVKMSVMQWLSQSLLLQDHGHSVDGEGNGSWFQQSTECSRLSSNICSYQHAVVSVSNKFYNKPCLAVPSCSRVTRPSYFHMETSYVAICFYENMYGITKIIFTKIYCHRKIRLFMKIWSHSVYHAYTWN